MKHIDDIKIRDQFFETVPENAIFVLDGEALDVNHNASVLKVLYNREVFLFDNGHNVHANLKTTRDLLGINTTKDQDQFWNLLSFIPDDVYIVETEDETTLTIPENYFKNEIGDYLLENDVKFYNLFR